MPLFVRFIIAFTVLALAVAGGYFSKEPTSRTFLYGASIMLLLPLTFVSLLDIVRDIKSGKTNRRNVFIQAILFIPVALLALCSLAIGVYLLFPLVSGPANSLGDIIAGVLMAVAFIAFGIKLFRILWCRYQGAIVP